EALGRGVSRVDEVAAALESRPANLVTLRLAAPNTESHDAGRRHLDRSDAHLTVALREVTVAGGKQGAPDRDRKQQFAALGELLDAEVPAVFAWRQRAQPVRCGSPRSRRGADGVGRQRQALALRDRRLTSRPGVDLLT